MITTNPYPKIYLLSDTHLIANKLHDNGPAFQKMRDTSAGKDLDYQEIMLTTFVRKILNDKPDAVIITGDLTFNGAKLSGQRLAEIFSPLQKAGIAFLPLPGNHDINDGWARKFENNVQYRTPQISPEDWKKLFTSSYALAESIDPKSLSYAVNLNDNYRLILADSNIYPETNSKTHPQTNGYLTPAQLKWIKSQLQITQNQNQHILFFMHHNLYDHNEIINGSFTLDNTEELQDLFNKYHVQATFSGHIHAQNIIPANSQCPSFDVASSCFSMCDQGYGIISLSPATLDYQRSSFDSQPFLTSKEKESLPITDFHQYLKDIFFKVNQQQLQQYQDLFTSETDWELITRLMNNLNWNFFIGKSDYNYANRQKIQASATYKLLKQKLPMMVNYINSLMMIPHPSQEVHLKW